MQYTIKKTELAKLSAARELQTRETAESYFRETGQVIGGGAGEMNRDFANVKFVNGSTFELCLPIGKLKKWTGFLPATADELEISFEPGPRVKLVSGGSEIAVQCTGGDSGENAKAWAAALGAAIPCVAPKSGGEFIVQSPDGFTPDPDIMGKIKAARKVAAAQKKDEARRKAYGSARQAEKGELAKLKGGAADYVAAGGIMAGGTAGEIARQRLILQARRELRQALLTPEIIPAWLPETYTHDRTDFVDLLNEDGSPKVLEIFADEYAAAKAAHAENQILAAGVAERNGEKFTPAAFIPLGFWVEGAEIKSTETVDAREKYASYVAAVVAARGELESYKPRASKFPSFYRANRGRHAPLLKHEKLAVELKAAQTRLDCFIREMFCKAGEAKGLPAGIGKEWFKAARDLSRARITARQWAGRKAEIVSSYLEARNERLACEMTMRAAGTVRARAIGNGLPPGNAIFVSASQIARQCEKVFATGASVEILESSNPLYPVGIIAPKVAAVEPAAVADEGQNDEVERPSNDMGLKPLADGEGWPKETPLALPCAPATAPESVPAVNSPGAGENAPSVPQVAPVAVYGK